MNCALVAADDVVECVIVDGVFIVPCSSYLDPPLDVGLYDYTPLDV